MNENDTNLPGNERARFDTGKAPKDPETGDFINGVKEKAGELLSTASSRVQSWTSEVGDVVSQTKDKAKQVATAAAHEAVRLEDEFAAFIRRYPIQCLVAGAAFGFLLAHLTRRNQSADSRM